MFPSILIVDDEPSIIRSLSGLLSDEGFEVLTASNGYEALKIIEAELPDLVLLDIWMPGIDGIETLKEIKKNDQTVQVIMITGHGTIETAVEATKLGAFSFIEKPLSFDKIVVAINNALNFRKLEEENKYLRKKTIEKYSITGNSPPTKALKKQLAAVAPSDSWILITGENGTGKELVAQTIHQLSLRSEEPFIDVNCAAIPEQLIESELFGHEKGVLSGFSGKKRGKFELAGKGTLFLDEIGDMNLKTQAKILRTLQEQTFQSAGGSRTIDFKARIIAASNMDLEKQIENNRFREDLYYRLNVVPLHVEPLRNRKEDIPLLAATFLEEYARQYNNKRKSITSQALSLIIDYPWPGNIRELKNLMERLAIMVEQQVIDVSDLPEFYNIDKNHKKISTESQIFSMENLKEAKKAFEKEFIRRKFLQKNSNVAETAQAIGVSRSYLYLHRNRKNLNSLEKQKT